MRWDSDKTLHLLERITKNGTESSHIKVINDENELIPNIFDRHHETIIADLSCGNLPNIFSKISRSMFNFYKIVLFDSSIGMHNHSIPIMDTKIRQLFQNSAITPMSQIFFISDDFVENKFSLKQDDFALSGVKTTDLTHVLRRRNLQGLQLKASLVIVNNDSLNHLDDYRDIHIDAVSKIGYILTNTLIRFLNATVQYSIVSTWGYLNQTTGKWSGMVGQILNDTDIGASPLFLTGNRVSMLEYISRPSSARGGFVFRQPKLSYTNNIYILPFDRLLWMCLVFLVLIIGIFLFVAVMVELKVFKSLKNDCQTSDMYMIVYGALCQQGTPITPNSITSRTIVAIAFIILMFLYVSYSANIVALLQSPSNQMKPLQDLYQSKMDASVEDTVYNRYYFPLVTEPLRKKFYDDKLCHRNGKFQPLPLEEGIKKVREGQFAYYAEFSGAYNVISETFLDIEKCGLKEIPYFQMNLDPWYAVQKNSSYKDLLKIGMMRIQEHGIQKRENLLLYTTKPKCLNRGGDFASASLEDTGPAAILLGWGFGVTLFVFICEFIHAKFTVIRQLLPLIVKKNIHL